MPIPSSFVVPACALLAIGVFYAAVRLTPGLRPNGARRARKGKRARKASGKLKANAKRSMAARGILVVPKEGL